MITRGFYGFIIAGLFGLQIQAAFVDVAQPDLLAALRRASSTLTNTELLQTLGKIEADIAAQDAAITVAASSEASTARPAIRSEVLIGYVRMLVDIQGWITAQETTAWTTYPWPTEHQPLPSVEEQILGYDIPAGKTMSDVLMAKVTLGVNFASPEIKDPLKRYRLGRLHRQMGEIHSSTGITMDNLYQFGLILSSLLANPDLETDKLEVQDRYAAVPRWFNGYSWLSDSLAEQTKGALSTSSYGYTDPEVKALGVQDPAIIFEPSGHFGFHEMNRMYFRPDANHRRYLVGIGFKGSVHGGSINGAVTRYLHDLTHGNTSEYGSVYGWRKFPVSEFLLRPIFENRDSLPPEQQQLIDFALFQSIVDGSLSIKQAVMDLPAGASQKALGIAVLEATNAKHRVITAFDLGLDDIAREIHRNLLKQYDSQDLNLRQGSDTVTGELRYTLKTIPDWSGQDLGTCTYDFTMPRSLNGLYTFTLREVTPVAGLTAAHQAQYDAIAAELSASSPKEVTHSSKEFRVRNGDRVKSLHWLESGKWVSPPQWRGKEAYTWDTVLYYQAGMQRLYDALLAKGLELWSEDPIPADMLASFKTTAEGMFE